MNERNVRIPLSGSRPEPTQTPGTKSKTGLPPMGLTHSRAAIFFEVVEKSEVTSEVCNRPGWSEKRGISESIGSKGLQGTDGSHVRRQTRTSGGEETVAK